MGTGFAARFALGLIVASLLAEPCGAQAWARRYPGVTFERVAAMPDGGFAVAGNNVVMRLDSLGYIVWQRSVDDSVDVTARGLDVASDGSIFAVLQPGSGNRVLLKLLDDGTIDWQIEWLDSTPTDVLARAGGGCVVVGSRAPAAGEALAVGWMASVDAAGAVASEATFATPVTDLNGNWLRDIAPAPGGGFLVLAEEWVLSGILQVGRTNVLRFDAAEQMIDAFGCGPYRTEEGSARVTALPTGGFAVAQTGSAGALTTSFYHRLEVRDPDGQLAWARSFPFSFGVPGDLGVACLTDGTLGLWGCLDGGAPSDHGRVAAAAPGDTIWEHAIGNAGMARDWSRRLDGTATLDGGFAVVRADTLVRHVASGDISALACVRVGTETFFGVPDTTVAPVDSWISETTTSRLGAGGLTLRAGSLVLDPDCDRVAEPSALDLDAAAEPLRVTREAGSLGFTWQDVGVERYDIHRGTVASVHGGIYDHSRTAACGVTATAASLTDDPGSFYFLVTGRVRGLESSYGRDSLGRERDIGLVICP